MYFSLLHLFQIPILLLKFPSMKSILLGLFGLLLGYLRINSYYGKRTSPTVGASTFHKGVDIGTPEGAKLVAICDGTISFLDFLRWWWIYPYPNTRRLKNYLLSYRPRFSGSCWRYRCTRTSHCTCWS